MTFTAKKTQKQKKKPAKKQRKPHKNPNKTKSPQKLNKKKKKNQTKNPHKQNNNNKKTPTNKQTKKPQNQIKKEILLWNSPHLPSCNSKNNHIRKEKNVQKWGQLAYLRLRGWECTSIKPKPQYDYRQKLQERKIPRSNNFELMKEFMSPTWASLRRCTILPWQKENTPS